MEVNGARSLGDALFAKLPGRGVAPVPQPRVDLSRSFTFGKFLSGDQNNPRQSLVSHCHRRRFVEGTTKVSLSIFTLVLKVSLGTIFGRHLLFFMRTDSDTYVVTVTIVWVCFPSAFFGASPHLGDGLEYALALRSAVVYVIGICSVPLLFPCRTSPEASNGWSLMVNVCRCP